MMVIQVMTVDARISQRYSNGRETTLRRKMGPGWTELSELRGLVLDVGALPPGPEDAAAAAADCCVPPPRVDVTEVLLAERTLPSRALDGLLEKYNLRVLQHSRNDNLYSPYNGSKREKEKKKP